MIVLADSGHLAHGPEARAVDEDLVARLDDRAAVEGVEAGDGVFHFQPADLTIVGHGDLDPLVAAVGEVFVLRPRLDDPRRGPGSGCGIGMGTPSSKPGGPAGGACGPAMPAGGAPVNACGGRAGEPRRARGGRRADRRLARAEDQRASRDDEDSPQARQARLGAVRSTTGRFIVTPAPCGPFAAGGGLVWLGRRLRARGGLRRSAWRTPAAGTLGRGGIRSTGGQPKRKAASGPVARSGTRPPIRTIATGRPSVSATASGSLPGGTSNQFGCALTSLRRQGGAGIFDVDHAGHELARRGKLQVLAGQLDLDRKAGFLAGRGIKAVDHLDRRIDLHPLPERQIDRRRAGKPRRPAGRPWPAWAGAG